MQVHDFIHGKFKQRVEFVEIPRLCNLCQKEDRDQGGEKCQAADDCAFLLAGKVGVKVRGLDGLEHAKIQSGASKELHKIAYALLSASGESTANAVKKFLGVEGAPAELEQQICFLEAGVIWPEFKSDERVRFAAYLNKFLRADFLSVYQRIGELTGQGACPEG